MFDSMIIPVTMLELIEQGFLCPYEIIRPPVPLKPTEIAQSPVEAYQQNCPGEKAIVFALHINAAKEFLSGFVAAGIPAVLVTGAMGSDERRKNIGQYKSGRARVFVNVGIAIEGWDDPPTSCIIFARSIGSVGFYIQACGRGLRTYPGKSRLLIIDLHGSSHVHGAPDDDREWCLEGEAIKRAKTINPERWCPGCGVLLEGDVTICDLCATARPEMVPPTVVNVALVKFAAKRREDNTKRIETFARWLGEAQAKGHKPGAVWHKYKAVYSIAPSQEIVSGARLLLKSRRAKVEDE